MKKALLLVLCASSIYANNVTTGVAGRVSVELIGSDAAFRNTLSVISPAVGVAITGCRLEPADGLGGVRVLSEASSQRGCRVDLDSDTATPGIQGFAAGTTFELGMCAQTDGDDACEFVWSSNPASNADGFDHVQTTTIVAGQAFRLNWEDQTGGGDSDFNDLIAVFRVAADADGDGLWDDWETTGIDTDGNGTIDLDLPALGANPQRKNLFLEIDWMDCAVAGSDCAAGDNHSHRPLNAAVTAVVNAFANAATVTNPDGSTGITLRIDVSNSIAHQNALNIPGLCFNGGAGIGNFDTVKANATNFGPNNPRRFAYRYSLWTHQQIAGNTTSGCGELPGNDFQVSLGGWNYFCNGGTRNNLACGNIAANCPGGGVCQAGGDQDADGNNDQDTGTVAQQAGTLMHEFGHNLNLQHGGGDSVNWKPNYLSTMNYWFQLGWIPPTPRLDYSRGALANLTETNLNETVGISDGTDNTAFYCPNFNSAAGVGTGGIDWNCDGDTTDNPLRADVNADPICTVAGPNNVRNSIPAGDDIINGTMVLDGPDFTCNTAAAGDDIQVRNVGVAQPVLNGFDDWANLLYNFQSTVAYEDGVHLSIVPVVELTFEELFAQAGPDVSLQMTASTAAPVTGTNFSFTITVQNNRPSPTGPVVVTDQLPAQVTFVSCAAPGGVCGGSGNNRIVTFPGLPGGGSAAITFVVSLNCDTPNGAAIINDATAETTPDANPDNNGASVTVVASNPAPVITDVAVSKTELWPANHKMVDVVVSYQVTDSCPVTRSLTVSSNEPLNGTGDGDATPDWEVLDATRIRLRAERAGTGSGREYTITITAADSGGATSTATTIVRVPRNR